MRNHICILLLALAALQCKTDHKTAPTSQAPKPTLTKIENKQDAANAIISASQTFASADCQGNSNCQSVQTQAAVLASADPAQLAPALTPDNIQQATTEVQTLVNSETSTQSETNTNTSVTGIQANSEQKFLGMEIGGGTAIGLGIVIFALGLSAVSYEKLSKSPNNKVQASPVKPSPVKPSDLMSLNFEELQRVFHYPGTKEKLNSVLTDLDVKIENYYLGKLTLDELKQDIKSWESSGLYSTIEVQWGIRQIQIRLEHMKPFFNIELQDIFLPFLENEFSHQSFSEIPMYHLDQRITQIRNTILSLELIVQKFKGIFGADYEGSLVSLFDEFKVYFMMEELSFEGKVSMLQSRRDALLHMPMYKQIEFDYILDQVQRRYSPNSAEYGQLKNMKFNPERDFRSIGLAPITDISNMFKSLKLPRHTIEDLPKSFSIIEESGLFKNINAPSADIKSSESHNSKKSSKLLKTGGYAGIALGAVVAAIGGALYANSGVGLAVGTVNDPLTVYFANLGQIVKQLNP